MTPEPAAASSRSAASAASKKTSKRKASKLSNHVSMQNRTCFFIPSLGEPKSSLFGRLKRRSSPRIWIRKRPCRSRVCQIRMMMTLRKLRRRKVRGRRRRKRRRMVNPGMDIQRVRIPTRNPTRMTTFVPSTGRWFTQPRRRSSARTLRCRTGKCSSGRVRRVLTISVSHIDIERSDNLIT